MTEAILIRRNSVFIFISTILRVSTNFILFWLIAYYYSEEIFGRFAFAQTLSTIFLVFADFGFDILLTTEIAKDKNKSNTIFQKYYSLKIVFSVVALLFMWLVVLFDQVNHQTRILIFIFSFFMIFSALTNFIFAYFKGLEKMEYETKVSTIINVGLLLAIIISVVIKVDIIIIGVIFLLSRIIGFILAVYYAISLKNDLSFKLNLSDFESFKKVLVFGMFLLFNNLFFQIDTLLLGLWKGEYEVGVYQSVFKLILFPLIIPDILSNAIMPTLSRFYMNNFKQWEKTGYIMNKLLSAITIPITLVIYIYAEQIVVLLYGGHKYLEAISVLRILSLTMFFRMTFEAFALLLTTSNRQHIRMWTVIVATLINVTFNYFFIRDYGALGASFVACGTNLFIVLIYIFILRKLFLKWMFNFNNLFFYLFSTFIFLIGLHFQGINLFIGSVLILIITSVYIYFVFFSSEERKVIFSTELGISFFKKR